LKLKLLLCSLAMAASLCAQRPAGTLTNQRIGDLVQAGVSSSEIIRIIGSAQTVNFDLRPGSTDNLLSAGVSEEIIKAMAAKENGGSTSGPATAPASVQATLPATARPEDFKSSDWTLHEGTPVRIRIMSTVSSATAQEGQNVDFETLDDIAVNGVTVIPRNSVALATVTTAESKRRMGRGGKLGMNIDYVRLPTGEKLALRGIESLKGGGHVGAMTGAVVVTAIAFWHAAPFFLFMHGKDVKIPEGFEVRVYTNTDYKVVPSRF
jgi:hypothetical protein